MLIPGHQHANLITITFLYFTKGIFMHTIKKVHLIS